MRKFKYEMNQAMRKMLKLSEKLIAIILLSCIMANVVVSAKNKPHALPDNIPVLAQIPGKLPSFNGAKVDWSSRGAWKQTTPTRSRLCINGLWQFQPADLAKGLPQKDQWAYLKVPGAWWMLHGVNHTPYKIWGKGTTNWKNKPEGSIKSVWYRRTFRIPKSLQGKNIWLTTRLISVGDIVYVDGKKVGPFPVPADKQKIFSRMDKKSGIRFIANACLDISKFIKPGKVQTLAIYTDKPVYSSLFLESTAKGQLLRDIEVCPSVKNKQLTVRFRLDGKSGEIGSYALTVRDAKGKTVLEKAGLTASKAGPAGFISVTADWKNPVLWNLDSPVLYTAVLEAKAKDGKVIDSAWPVQFGFRDFTIKGKDFLLNGKPIHLKSYALYSFGFGNGENIVGIGASNLDRRAVRRQLNFMKQLGYNHIYLAGYASMCAYPCLDILFEECDRYGFLISYYPMYGGVLRYMRKYIIAQARARKSRKELRESSVWKQGLATWRKRIMEVLPWYWNHPSLVMYVVGMNSAGAPGEELPYYIGRDYHEKFPSPWGGNREFMGKIMKTFKTIDPDHIVYSHMCTNFGPVYTDNRYLNFMPLQEVEDYIEDWNKHGTKPILFIEYGSPLSWDFKLFKAGGKGIYHRDPGFTDGEPCATEYSAMYLGENAYGIEKDSYNKRLEKWYYGGRHWKGLILGIEEAGYFPMHSKFIRNNYRTWRAYGIPGGMIEWAFRNVSLGGHKFAQGGKANTAHQEDNLQTPYPYPDYYVKWRPSLGPDRHLHRNYNLPSLPETGPVGKLDWTNPIYNALKDSLADPLVYIDGNSKRISAKDHSFFSGEKIVKQIIACYDKCVPFNGEVKWQAVLGDKSLAKGSFPLKLAQGAIVKTPVSFKAPEVSEATSGKLTASVTGPDNFRKTMSFDFRVFPKLDAVKLPGTLKIALYDPKKLTSQWLKNVEKVNDPRKADADLLVIGREAMTRPETPGFQWYKVPKMAKSIVPFEPMPASKLPFDINKVAEGQRVLIFEQNAPTLEGMGFRTISTVPRYVFATAGVHPALKGIAPEDLIDWRGAGTMVPSFPKDQLPRHANRYCRKINNQGSVASVVVEKPHLVGFTPILQTEFGLDYTPLLSWKIGKGMIVFCQLDIQGRYGNEPAATRIAGNLLKWLSEYKGDTGRRICVMAKGKKDTVEMLAKIGVKARAIPIIQILENLKVPDTTKGLLVLDANFAGLSEYNKRNVSNILRQGFPSSNGAAVLALGMDKKILDVFPVKGVEFAKEEICRTLLTAKDRKWDLLKGLSTSDFYWKGFISLPVIKKVPAGGRKLSTGVIAEVPVGEGRWVFCQVTPDDLDYSKLRYLRFGKWRCYNLISQLLTNLGADADVNEIIPRIGKREGLYAEPVPERGNVMDDPYTYRAW